MMTDDRGVGGAVLTDKKQAYQALVSDVKECYTAQEAEHKDEPVYLTWYGNSESQPPQRSRRNNRNRLAEKGLSENQGLS